MTHPLILEGLVERWSQEKVRPIRLGLRGQYTPGWNNPFRNLPSHEEIIVSILLKLGKASRKPGERCDWPEFPCGQPDLVTDTHIYEVKVVLTSSAIQRGIGQLLLYGLDWPGRKLILVGYDHRGSKLKSYVEKLGIEVEILKEPDHKQFPS